MSLADELEALIAKSKVADGKGSSAKVLQDALEVMGFVAMNLPAISAALRGRDAVLEEAALVAEGTVPECCGVPDHNPETGETYCCGNPSPRWLTPDEAAAAIRAMKEGKHV